MATTNTTKTNGKGSSAKKATTTKTGRGSASSAKKTGTKSQKKTTSKGVSKAKTASGKPVPKEELVPELSNELVLLVTLVVSVLLFLSNFSLSGKVGEVINQVTFGLFGLLAYLIPFVLFLGIAFYLANREINRKYIVKLAASIGLFAVLSAIIQLLFGNNADITELLQYYKTSAETKTGGGLLGGIICWVLIPLFGKIGSYVVLIAISILCLMLLTGKALFAFLAEISGEEMKKQKELHKIRSEERQVYREERRMQYEEQMLQRGEELRLRREEQERQRTSRAQSFLLPPKEQAQAAEPVPKRVLERNFFGGFSKTAPVRTEVPEEKEVSVEKEALAGKEVSAQNEMLAGKKVSAENEALAGKKMFAENEMFAGKKVFAENEALAGKKMPVEDEAFAEKKISAENEAFAGKKMPVEDETFAEKKISAENEAFVRKEIPVLDKETEELIYTGNFQPSKDTMDAVNSIYEEELRKKFDKPKQETAVKKEAFVQEITLGYEEPFEPSFSEQALLDKRQPESPKAKEAFAHAAYGIPTAKTAVEEKKEQQEIKAANKATADDIAQVAEEAEAAQEEKIPEYQFPPVELLSRPVHKNTGNSEEELQQTAHKLKTTLESFGVRVTINNVSRGPSVTRYELQPEQGVKVSKITGLADDIKLNLAAADVRIEAPIPGKAAIGIEVPNKENTAVLLRELIESPDFINHSSNLAFTVGKDIGGQCVVADIAKMPHVLIAGATGSGKSVCINTIIMSILYKAHPNDVKMIMVDPKVVELSVYNGIPHLLIPVVTDPKKASAALNWAVTEMMERYEKFAALGVRDLKGYNKRVEEAAEEGHVDEKFPKLPQIVIIVDELADLMMVAPGEVEDAICRLAQLARAAGIHLIIATQRPSVNVITGLIKANVPSRVAFAVSSGVDSRTILDSVGAEKLLGKGDMLFHPSGYPKPVRIQGAFVSDKEVNSVVDFLKGQSQGVVGYNEEISQKIASGAATEAAASGPAAAGTADNGKDEYFAEAGRFIIEKEKASIGMLQRVYKIGFNRAARIMDQLSEAGVVGPEEGTKPRKILMTMEEFEALLK